MTPLNDKTARLCYSVTVFATVCVCVCVDTCDSARNKTIYGAVSIFTVSLFLKECSCGHISLTSSPFGFFACSIFLLNITWVKTKIGRSFSSSCGPGTACGSWPGLDVAANRRSFFSQLMCSRCSQRSPSISPPDQFLRTIVLFQAVLCRRLFSS